MSGRTAPQGSDQENTLDDKKSTDILIHRFPGEGLMNTATNKNMTKKGSCPNLRRKPKNPEVPVPEGSAEFPTNMQVGLLRSEVEEEETAMAEVSGVGFFTCT